ncbi:MAG: DUF4339 domain-containing protein [Chloroflexi bacterium]|nr:DUF4339 domain-containing protein [Chloroflexota bacterium]
MSSYYIAKDGKQAGPYEETKILRMVETGELGRNDLCWQEGMEDWKLIGEVLYVAPPKISLPPAGTALEFASEKSSPLFLYIPISRLIILSIVSFGLYEAYWIYKNWRYIKERDGLKITPFWRGMFGVFFCHSLLHGIHDDKEANSIQVPDFSPGALATGWVVLVILSNVLVRFAEGALLLIGPFIPSFLCLVPVQKYINSITEKRIPGMPYYGWSAGHIVCLVWGIIIWGLVILGLVLPQ